MRARPAPANSTMLSFTVSTPPWRPSRRMTVASRSMTWSRNGGAPQVVGPPRAANRSLTPYGMPPRIGASEWLRRRSARRASARARSGSNAATALKRAPISISACRAASASSSGETALRRSIWARSGRVAKRYSRFTTRRPMLRSAAMRPALAMVLAVLLSACGGIAPPALPSPTPAPAGTSLADLAVYQGADREQMLIEGARKEGKAVLYTSNSQIEGLMTDFQKKYPFIKVDAVRGQNTEIQQRLREEFRANTVLADVVESSGEGMGQMVPLDVFQEYFSPDLAAYDESSITRGPGGNVLVLADREVYPGLAWNTNLVNSAEAPKTFDDLLDQKWKGKMGIVSSSTGTNWVGLLMNVKGEEYVKKIAQQQVKVQNITAAALTDLVVSGEVPMSPVIGYADVLQAQAKGAPIQW